MKTGQGGMLLMYGVGPVDIPPPGPEERPPPGPVDSPPRGSEDSPPPGPVDIPPPGPVDSPPPGPVDIPPPGPVDSPPPGYLIKRGLSPSLFDAANEPRKWGDVTAHVNYDPLDITIEDVAELVEYLDLVLEMVYLLPAKFDRSKLRRKAVEERSAHDEKNDEGVVNRVPV